MWMFSSAAMFGVFALTLSPWFALPALGMLALAVVALTSSDEDHDDEGDE